MNRGHAWGGGEKGQTELYLRTKKYVHDAVGAREGKGGESGWYQAAEHQGEVSTDE